MSFMRDRGGVDAIDAILSVVGYRPLIRIWELSYRNNH